ncbi:MAG: PAS domain S-box-containing protein [Planctomycetota bacterium]|jgi:PAS domain S-box-containing protein
MVEESREELVRQIGELRRKLVDLEADRVKERSASMLESIVRAVPDVIYRLDGQGRFLYVNDAVRRYGYQPEELLGHSILDLVHPEDKEKAVYKVNDRRTGTRSTRMLHVRLLCKDNTVVPFELNTDTWPIFLVNAEGIYAKGEEDCEFLCTQGVARDVSGRADDSAMAVLCAEVQQRRKAEEALLLTQFAVDRAGEGIFWFGADGRIIYANQEICTLLGYTRDQLLSMHVYEVGGELPDSGKWEELWAEIRQGPATKTSETTARAHDGRTFPVEVAANYLNFNGREVVCSYLRDITQRQRGEVRRSAAQHVHDEVWKMRAVEDIDKVIRVVREELEMMGVAVQGCSIHLVDEAASPKVRSWRNNTEDGKWANSDNESLADRILSMWRAGQPVFRSDLEAEDEQNEREFIVGQFGYRVRSVLDIPFSHGLLAINNAAPNAFSAEDVQSLQSIAVVLSDGFRRLEDLRGLEGRTRSAEKATVELAGAFKREGVLGRVRDRVIAMRRVEDMPSEDFWLGALSEVGVEVSGISLQFPGTQPGMFRLYGFAEYSYSHDMPLEQAPWVGEAWRSGRCVEVDRARIEAVGLASWHMRSIVEMPFKGLSGSMAVNSESRDSFSEQELRVVALFAGLISEGLQRLRDFEAVKASQEQLRQAQKMEAVGELAAGVAHNFNNLLQGIVGNIHLARMETSGEAKRMLDAAEETSMRAADMVRQLMLFAHKDFLQENRDTDLLDAASKAVEIARGTFDRHIQITEEYLASTLPVRGDVSHLQQVFINLLINARDALDGCVDPQIRIRCEQVNHPDHGPMVRIEVEDNGAGMTEQTRARIYDPFFTTKPVDKGTGLGLSTVYGIVQQHGGWMNCCSEKGHGTSMTIHLPLAVSVDSDIYDETSSARVLIVDDEETVRRTAQQILEQRGYRVYSCSSFDAVEVALREKPDLVLLDLSMNVTLGREVLDEMQARGVDAKVIASTEDWFGAEDIMGVDGVVHKPIPPDELIRQVHKVLTH